MMAGDGRETRVVDTNVLAIASNRDEPSPACVLACIARLRALEQGGCVALDEGWEILKEYQAVLGSDRQAGVGEAFLKWLLTNLGNPERVVWVPITPGFPERTRYRELPESAVNVDPSDRKFLAVAAAHPDKPPILQAFDSKWWGWAAALARDGVIVEFLCPEEIAEKHEQKMGQR